MMEREVRERLKCPVAETWHVGWLRGEALRMTNVAAQLREDFAPVLSGDAQRITNRVAIGIHATREIALSGSPVEAHESREIFNVRRDKRVHVSWRRPDLKRRIGLVLWKLFGCAVRPRRSLVGKEFVGDAHFDIGCLGRKKQQGFILRLPSKTGHCAIVRGAVDDTVRDGSVQAALCGRIVDQVGVRHVFDQPQPERGSRYAKGYVVIRQLGGDVRLRRQAPGWSIGAPLDRKQPMYAAIQSTPAQIRLIGNEANLANRSVRLDESGIVFGICRAEKLSKIDLRILRKARCTDAWAAAADGRLRVAHDATIPVEGWPESANGGIAGVAIGRAI